MWCEQEVLSIEHLALQKNFGKPVEWALVKDHAWSTAQLRKLDVPVSSVYFSSLLLVRMSVLYHHAFRYRCSLT